jgi:shikimate kinase
MTPECAEIVREQTLCIYLRASVETLVEHLSAGEAAGRPMLQGGCHSERHNANEESALRARIEGLMALRAETYERTAHIVIDTDGKSIEEIAEIIKESI